VYGAFVQLDEQTPPADTAFVPVPPDSQNDWLNGGYAVQWLLFAAMTLFAYGWLARRQARGPAAGRSDARGSEAGRPDARGSEAGGGAPHDAPAEVAPPR
jgi:hypothetical protein